MRSRRRTFAAIALAVALGAPAIPLAAQEAEPPAADPAPPSLTPGNVRPEAALDSTAREGKVAFDATDSTDPDGSIAGYEWDLDGDSVYETKTGAEPRAERSYRDGTTLVAAVRVTDDAGASDEATATVAIPGAPEPRVEPELVPTSQLDDASDEAEPVARDERPAKPAEPAVRAAASKSVTITDFEFGPSTVNVNVGDTVTWNNRGPTVHTATAEDGSFDSGNLARGRSYSRKFSASGTFAYICTPHPFMRARVVVAGSGGSGGGSGSSGGGNDSGDNDDDSASAAGASGSGDDASATDGGSGDGGLAKTGIDLAAWALFGLGLAAFGAAVRFRLTAE